MPVNAISISIAAVFTLITFQTVIFASAIEGRLRFSVLLQLSTFEEGSYPSGDIYEMKFCF